MIKLIVFFIALLFSVIVHEVAHGIVAYWCGDTTAKDNGRLTLNPLPHIDPFMTIIVPLVMYFGSGGTMMFGGAKPVPVNPYNLRKLRRDMILVSLAGPLSNFVLALFSGLCFSLLNYYGQLSPGLVVILRSLYSVNMILLAFNLIPIPPLDGSKVLMGFLPDEAAEKYARIEPYGFYILMGLMFVGALHLILMPIRLVFDSIISIIIGLTIPG